MKLKIKYTDECKEYIQKSGIQYPKYETPGSAGFDLISTIDFELNPGEWRLIPTGLEVEIPQGNEMQVRPRSGLAYKNGISVLNAPGTIDSDFRGEVKVNLFNHSKEVFVAKKGNRVAQGVIAPVKKAEFVEVDELTQTERGEGGFGSTGK